MARCDVIDQLKAMLLGAEDTAKSLGQVIDFYLDNVDVSAGKPTTFAPIDQALSQFTGLPFENTPLKQVAACRFIHAAFRAGQEPGNVIYFEDERKGLLCVVVSRDPPERTYARFTVPAPYARLFTI
ncbi:MAG TPA: hypothetical protein VFW33_02755 [Gemmataceae bacterium]|nr:hypothetical protein [Gemmataceae bacterium]